MSRRHLLAATVTAALLLTACGSSTVDPPTASGTGNGSSSASITSSDLGAIRVTGALNTKPGVVVPTPFSVKTTQRSIISAGTGPQVMPGQRVTINYVGINGTDGKEFAASYGKDASSFVLDPKQYLPGLVTGLTGAKVGSRVLVAVPPADGYGVKGQPQANIGPTDTLVVVADIVAAKDVLARATGTAVAPKAGLPTVKLDAKGKPTITLPAGKAPAALVIQPLIAGTGAVVTKGQQITVNYIGIVWPGGKQFDSSWDRGAAATFPIGVGQVVTGWDLGLVGQKVGSQVLLVIPPDKGYGAEGNAQAGIKGTDTLVFVVDILDAS